MNKPEQLYKYLCDVSIEITNCYCISENVIWLVYREKNGYVNDNESERLIKQASVIQGIYITSWGRLRLIDYLKRMDTNNMQDSFSKKKARVIYTGTKH